MKTHKLTNGAAVLSISGHGFRFSDGTESEAQEMSIVDFFTLRRQNRKVGEIKGMPLNEVRMALAKNQQDELKRLSELVDIVIVPFPVLAAMREQGIRDEFPNCVAFNATPETQRSAPQDKVVDITNWSY